MENKSVWTSVPQTACTSCVGKLSGDSTADQEHILNYVFLCGLVCNLINCGNVARMSQLSVAPQSIPKESHSVLSLLIISALPSMAPPPRAQITSLSHTFDKKKFCLQHWWWWLVIHVQITAEFAFLVAVVYLVLGAMQEEQSAPMQNSTGKEKQQQIFNSEKLS